MTNRDLKSVYLVFINSRQGSQRLVMLRTQNLAANLNRILYVVVACMGPTDRVVLRIVAAAKYMYIDA